MPLLVDSAAGFGAGAADGLAVGAQGDAEIVSFHITKPLGIGEGGAVFAGAELAERMHRLANFDFDEHRSARSPWGLNAKLDELHAAVGLAVLDTFDDDLARRRRHAERLLGAIGPGLTPQAGHEWGTYQFVPVVTPDGDTRERILKLADGRVELRTYYEPLHAMAAFAPFARHGSLEVTESLGQRSLSLPMATGLSDGAIAAVAEVCRGGA